MKMQRSQIDVSSSDDESADEVLRNFAANRDRRARRNRNRREQQAEAAQRKQEEELLVEALRKDILNLTGKQPRGKYSKDPEVSPPTPLPPPTSPHSPQDRTEI